MAANAGAEMCGMVTTNLRWSGGLTDTSQRGGGVYVVSPRSSDESKSRTVHERAATIETWASNSADPSAT